MRVGGDTKILQRKAGGFLYLVGSESEGKWDWRMCNEGRVSYCGPSNKRVMPRHLALRDCGLGVSYFCGFIMYADSADHACFNLRNSKDSIASEHSDKQAC